MENGDPGSNCIEDRIAHRFPPALPGQASLFEAGVSQEGHLRSRKAATLLDEIENLDIDRMTPLEALQKLYELKKKRSRKREENRSLGRIERNDPVVSSQISCRRGWPRAARLQS